MTPVRVKEVCVLNEQGLHARPAAKLAQEAQKFSCDINLRVGEQQVDAKSILDILSLAAGQGCGLEILADGDDAHEALDHLVSFFKTRCGEEA
jgi:phosphocarrier protein